MSNDPGFTPAPQYDESAETPAYAPPSAPAARRNSGKAIAALVCGIVSFPIGLGVGPLALPLSIAALVLGIISRREIAADPSLDGSGMALAGIIMGIVGIVLSVLFVILIIVAVSVFDDYSY